MLNKSMHHLATLLAILLAGGCSGGTGGTGVSNGGSNAVVSTGSMIKGSVIVNGVRYDDTTATIVVDDVPKTASDLRDGMVVKVVGRVNNDGVNGTAERVEAEIEVRGTPTTVNSSANPPSLVVLGQTVIADDQTVYSNLASFAAITTSTLIEIHGLRDAQNQIHATRIEANTTQMGDSTVDEIRGIVSGGSVTNPTSFNLGAQAINATGAVIAPANATYQNGSMIEVHCSQHPCVVGGVFQASRIEVESAEDSTFLPDTGSRYEVEGLVASFTSHPGNFTVNGTSVTTNSSTRFVGGITTDLANNIKIEAEGSWDGTTLTATKIEFKRSVIRLQGSVSAPSGNTFTLNVAGRTISIELDSLAANDFAPGLPPDGTTCVQVRGQRKAVSGAVVTASEVKNGCSNSGRHMLQAPVEAENPESTITLLGFVIDVSNPTDTPNQWLNINEAAITRAQFFNTVTPANPGPRAVAGTLVKVTFDNNNVDVRQAEIED